ncbi:hypothetical protein BC567DRAFT_263136 [Phyllosticta citribraziliensis]
MTAGVGASRHEHQHPAITDAAAPKNNSTIAGAPVPVASSSRYSQSTVAGNGGMADADDDFFCADADTRADTGSVSDSWSPGGEDAV